MANAAGTTPKFVATIDFGTTHCSVAYLIRPDLEPNPSEVDPTILTLDNAGNKRAPSCILFDSSGNKIAFGYEARELYASYKQELRPHFHYILWTREEAPEAQNGNVHHLYLHSTLKFVLLIISKLDWESVVIANLVWWCVEPAQEMQTIIILCDAYIISS